MFIAADKEWVDFHVKEGGHIIAANSRLRPVRFPLRYVTSRWIMTHLSV